MAWPIDIIALAEAHSTASAITNPRAAFKNGRFLSNLQITIDRAGTTGGGTVWGANRNGMSGPGFDAGNYGLFLGDGSTTTFDIPTNAYAALSNNNIIVYVSKSGRTGTAAVTAGSQTVTGTSTAFTTELAVGDEININGEVRTVTTIASTTSLTVDAAFVNTASGATVFLLDALLVPTTDFTVSNPSGTTTRITVGAAGKVPVGAKIEIHKVTPFALFTYATATVQHKQIESLRGAEILWYATDATATPSVTAVYARAMSV